MPVAGCGNPMSVNWTLSKFVSAIKLQALVDILIHSTFTAVYRNSMHWIFLESCRARVKIARKPSVKYQWMINCFIATLVRFAADGKCRYGPKCKFTHVSNPASGVPPAVGPGSNNFGRGEGKNGRSFNGMCNCCGIKGHKEADRRKKKSNWLCEEPREVSQR